jgi:hypothetical protein
VLQLAALTLGRLVKEVSFKRDPIQLGPQRREPCVGGVQVGLQPLDGCLVGLPGDSTLCQVVAPMRNCQLVCFYVLGQLTVVS